MDELSNEVGMVVKKYTKTSYGLSEIYGDVYLQAYI